MSGHGTRSEYTDKQCRCPECRKANSAYQARARERKAAGEPPEHGTMNAYSNWVCRCDLCKAVAKAENNRRYRERRDAQRA